MVHFLSLIRCSHPLTLISLCNVYIFMDRMQLVFAGRGKALLYYCQRGETMTSLWFGWVWSGLVRFLYHTKSHICHLFALNIHAAMVCASKVSARPYQCVINTIVLCVSVWTKWHFQLRKYTAADVVNSHITPTETHTRTTQYTQHRMAHYYIYLFTVMCVRQNETFIRWNLHWCPAPPRGKSAF